LVSCSVEGTGGNIWGPDATNEENMVTVGCHSFQFRICEVPASSLGSLDKVFLDFFQSVLADSVLMS
jgi:hypothetical protein